MQIIQTRRDFLASASLAAAASVFGSAGSRSPTKARRKPPPIRLVKQLGICTAPQYLADELLRAEGFTDVRYVQMPASRRRRWSGAATSTSGMSIAPSIIFTDGCRLADHDVGGRASRLLGAVRPASPSAPSVT